MPDIQNIVLPIAIILALTFVFGTIRRSVHNALMQAGVIGLVLGAAAVVAMAEPINLGFGVIVDLRTLMVALAIAFCGPLAGAIAVVMAIAFRLYLGGAGAMAGVTALALGYALALAWLYLIKPRIGRAWLSDIALGAMISLALVTGFMLPPEVRWTFILEIGPVVTASNVLGALLLGQLFRREMRAQQNEKLLEEIASLDPLTGALNRRGTSKRIEALSDDQPLGRAIFYFDLDMFKEVNDCYGHAAGDMALKAVADRVRSTIRADAIFSRIGGDEFTVLLAGVSCNAVRPIAERLCEVIRAAPLRFEGNVIPLSISLGAHWTLEPMSFEAICDAADANLMKSKEGGRDQATVSFACKIAGNARMLSLPELANIA